MLYLLEDEKLVLNYLIKKPEDCIQLKDGYFSTENRKIFEAIKYLYESNIPVDECQLRKANKDITPEMLADIKSEEHECTNLTIPKEQIKKAYIVRRAKSAGNNYIDTTYTIGDDFSMEFDKKTSEAIIKEIREQEAWMDKISNLDFNPFHGYKYYEIPGADAPIEWLVDGMFQKGTFNLAVGPAKSGKSQLCYQLSFCLQNGIDFFEKKVQKSNVLYVDWELSPKEITHRINLLQNFYNGPSEDGRTHDYQAPLFVPLFRTNYQLTDIVYGIQNTLRLHPEIDVIIFDNFYSFFDGDANASSAVKQTLKSIQSISSTATIFLVCHTNKDDGKNGGSKHGTYAAAGSNAFAGFADEFINIENKADGRIVKVDGRHVYPTQEYACRFCHDTYWQFQKVLDYSEISRIMHDGKSKEQLEKEYPELYALIGDDGKTLTQIQKEMPNETAKSLREKGFYSERNKERCREGFSSGRWYVEDPRRVQ